MTNVHVVAAETGFRVVWNMEDGTLWVGPEPVVAWAIDLARDKNGELYAMVDGITLDGIERGNVFGYLTPNGQVVRPGDETFDDLAAAQASLTRGNHD